VGPVSKGWLPGDPNTGPFTGTPLSNISNADNGGGAGSTAYRLWCASDTTRITDWGALTNLGPNLHIPSVSVSNGSTTVTAPAGYTFPSSVTTGQTVTDLTTPGDLASGTTISSISGNTLTLSPAATGTSGSSGDVLQIATGTTLPAGSGAAIEVPIRLIGVNTASGTEATFASYAESGVASGGCSSNMNTNDASDPNPVTDTGTNATPHVALENNSDQIDQFAQGDFPSPDYVDQAIEVATTLYIESNGVYNTNPYAAASSIDGTSYAGVKVEENGVSPTVVTQQANTYPTARTLFNIYNTTSVRASTGGFLNWICDGNTNFSKGLDNSTGKNFDTELTTIITGTFGFLPRLTDETSAPTIGTPADNQAAPNNTCAASLPVSTNSGTDTITLTAGGNFPPDIVNAGGLVGGLSVGVTGAGIPAGTTVVSGAGTSTLTLSANATATATGVATVFAGAPAVTAVTNSQS
jgi:hypothetical protein